MAIRAILLGAVAQVTPMRFEPTPRFADPSKGGDFITKQRPSFFVPLHRRGGRRPVWVWATASLALALGIGGLNTAVAKDKDKAEAEENLAVNPGFEDPAGEGLQPAAWNIFSTKKVDILTTQSTKKSGNQAVRMTAQDMPKAFQGMTQTIPVAAGEKYTFSADLINDKLSPLAGSVSGTLVIEWKNGEGKEINRAISPPWTRSLSRIRWGTVTIKKVEAPSDAVQAIFGIHLSEGEEGGKGSVVIDDVKIVRE